MNQEIMRSLGFGREVDNVNSNKCATCAGEVKGFRDNLSAKEYGISGMCQKCQDKVFGDNEVGELPNPYVESKEDYIRVMLEQGYLIFEVTSPGLLTHDIDYTLEKEICGDLITRSKNNGVHFYTVCDHPGAEELTWARKACIQFTNGSDPKRELLTLARRLDNLPFAELMCEVNTPETLAKLKEFESQGLGRLVTLEMLS